MGRAKKNVEVEAQVIARGNVVPMMTETESEETVQYVSDEDAAREDRLVSEIRMITEQTKQVVLFNSIEIGRRLTEAKAMVKRGTWGTWLKENEKRETWISLFSCLYIVGLDQRSRLPVLSALKTSVLVPFSSRTRLTIWEISPPVILYWVSTRSID